MPVAVWYERHEKQSFPVNMIIVRPVVNMIIANAGAVSHLSFVRFSFSHHLSFHLLLHRANTWFAERLGDGRVQYGDSETIAARLILIPS